jgi:uncharacterized membrane protein YjjP (DUF1212 family)
MTALRLPTDLLVQAGRLLLEYNESTEAIHRALMSTALALTKEPCHVAVNYNGVIVSLGKDAPTLGPVKELRYNTALQARVHAILKEVRAEKLDPSKALSQLENVEATTPRHSRWLAIIVLGIAASCLARLLGADVGAIAVVGVATGMGLFVRQQLGRRHFSLLTLPLMAAFVGALFGGVGIRRGWTRTPDLVLVVPALMLVPGPHLINGLLDLIDNHLPMSLARLWLAVGILIAAGLGIVIGIELTLPDVAPADQSARTELPSLFIDMVLAGIVTCGFAVFYNTAWRHVGLAIVGGMVGHGLRYLALEAGCFLEVATFLGSLAVGMISSWMARSSRTPVAVIGFAGAVTMMPGVHIYRAIWGTLQLARQPDAMDTAMVSETIGNAIQACLVISSLALGLILGARIVRTLLNRLERSLVTIKS